MRRATAAALAAALVALPAPAARGAGSELLGGFHPVAATESARLAWVNPGALGQARLPSIVLEGVWRGPQGSDPGLDDVQFVTFAVSTELAAYGVQLELDDLGGVADWTLNAAKKLGRGTRVGVGVAVEWRGGEENTFDGIVGVTFPAGRSVTGGFVVEDVFARDVDGAENGRQWRGGAALRPASVPGYLSWDWRDREDDPAPGRHWFGLGFDRAARFRFSGAVSTVGDWSAALHLGWPGGAVGGGTLEPDGGDPARFGSIEWRPQPRVVR